VPTSSTNSASRDDWQLYRQSNGGDGVTPQGSLIEHLLYMIKLYYNVEV
jgi:hypothetical protein